MLCVRHRYQRRADQAAASLIRKPVPLMMQWKRVGASGAGGRGFTERSRAQARSSADGGASSCGMSATRCSLDQVVERSHSTPLVPGSGADSPLTSSRCPNRRQFATSAAAAPQPPHRHGFVRLEQQPLLVAESCRPRRRQWSYARLRNRSQIVSPSERLRHGVQVERAAVALDLLRRCAARTDRAGCGLRGSATMQSGNLQQVARIDQPRCYRRQVMPIISAGVGTQATSTAIQQWRQAFVDQPGHGRRVERAQDARSARRCRRYPAAPPCPGTRTLPGPAGR